jgi:GDP-L-fucose synthase
MNILITGGNGFIARNIYKAIRGKYNVILTNRKSLDVLSGEEVDKFFHDNNIDVVIHTAVSGGSRMKTDEFSTLISNLIMFQNISRNKRKFGSLIHFGSGAEFDRRKNIISAKENEDSSPTDYYGLSKKIIKREIDKTENFYNFRVFGCFGQDELETRFIKSAIKNVKNKKPIKIHQNRYMDFIYIEDLCKIVDYYIEKINKKNLPKDINLCYNNKKSLLDIANKINQIMNKSFENVTIEKAGFDIEYTGDSSKLSSLELDLIGLDEGLKRCINV